VKEASGFTLVEAVVTFVIIAILAAAAIPALSVWMPNYRLRRAAMDIFSNLQWAKMQAIRTNRQHAIFFNPTGNGSYEVVDCGPDGTYTGSGDDVTVKTVNLLDYDDRGNIHYGHGAATTPVGTTFGDEITYPSPDNVATFNSRGFGNNGYIYIENDKNTTYAVGSTTAGVILLRKWDGTNWD
jgi:type IV fimbrial biogenesis protein FimT